MASLKMARMPSACRFSSHWITRIISKLARHEEAVRVGDVISKRRTGLEAELAVKPVGRREGGTRARLQAQPPVAAASGFRDDAFNDPTADTLSQVPGRGAHRFDFSMPGIQ